VPKMDKMDLKPELKKKNKAAARARATAAAL